MCQYCLQPIPQKAVYCPLCGKGAEQESSCPNNSATKKTKNKRVRLIINLIVLAVIIVGALGIIRHAAKVRYMNNIIEFSNDCISAYGNLDEITDTIQEEWYSCLSDGKHDGDGQKAIDEAYSIMDREFNDAMKKDDRLEISYKNIRNTSLFIADEETREMLDAAKELYACYLDYYSFTTEFNCSYFEYTETKSGLEKEFKSCRNDLKRLI